MAACIQVKEPALNSAKVSSMNRGRRSKTSRILPRRISSIIRMSHW